MEIEIEIESGPAKIADQETTTAWIYRSIVELVLLNGTYQSYPLPPPVWIRALIWVAKIKRSIREML